jgi:Kef-type K+ transport system membrane component KefB
VIATLRRRYGASPLHLLGHLVAIAIAVYAVSKVLHPRYSRGLNVLVWLLAGAILHDFVLVPAYALCDRLVRTLPHPVVNYMRFPAVISGVMLLVYWPLIFVRADGNYVRATGQHVEGFAMRWLLITAALFLASAIAYAARAAARGRAARRPRGRPGASPAGGGARGRG